MSKYIFKYVNEDEFNRCEKTIKKYDSLVYKKLLFSYYPNLKEGNFSGDLINQMDGVLTYSLEIPCTSQVQEKLYGNYKLMYSVYENEKTVLLESLEPKKLLKQSYNDGLTSYKGVMVSKKRPQKDMFKIDLINMLEEYDFNNKKDEPSIELNNEPKCEVELSDENKKIEKPKDFVKSLLYIYAVIIIIMCIITICVYVLL